MAKFPSYDKGDWDAICDDCGQRFKASELRLRWDGLMVDDKCWEPRQPQDFVRARLDIQAVPWSRPEPTDYFSLGCSTRTSISGFASAGCAITGNTIIPDTVPSGTFTP